MNDELKEINSIHASLSETAEMMLRYDSETDVKLLHDRVYSAVRDMIKLAGIVRDVLAARSK